MLGPASSRSVVANLELLNLVAASSAPSSEYTQFGVSGWKLKILHLEDFRAAATATASSLRGQPTLRPWDPASGLFLEPRGRPTGCRISSCQHLLFACNEGLRELT